MKHAGVYIHIPFCRTQCSYCDFATGAYERTLAERYVQAVVTEIKNFDWLNVSERIDTVYFGGGTPSLLPPPEIARLLEAVRARFHVSREAEVTMEIDPGTASIETLKAYSAHGVNRASFGVQTFDDAELRRLGRAHTANDGRQTLQDLRAAGFTNISFDLIAGLPAQTLAAWQSNLTEAIALEPHHMSLYLLEVHDETPLAAQLKRGRWPTPDPDIAAEMYGIATKEMHRAGYEHYEISSFCLPGRESRHNIKHWTGAPYYGFGCSAHSYDGAQVRWSNNRDIRAYTEAIEARGSAVTETINLNAHDRQAEALYLGLRLLNRGVDLDEHQARFNQDVRHEHASGLNRLTEAGLIELNESSNIMRLTSTGALLSNEVFAEFV